MDGELWAVGCESLPGMRRGTLAVLVCLTLVGCGRSAGKTGEPADTGESIGWQLADVSDDGLVVTAYHEDPHCETSPGPAQLTDDPERVSIRIPLLRRHLAKDIACTLDLRFMETKVRLGSPLAARRLEEPGRPVGTDLSFESRCPRVLRARPEAPLFDVPFFASQRARCLRPIPAAVSALPILQRPPAAADRLTKFERIGLRLERLFVLSRRARSAPLGKGVVVLVPGAEGSCALFRNLYAGGRRCATTPQIERRGLFADEAPDSCEGAPVGQRHVRVVGIAPPGVRSIRLTRRGRTVAHAQVRRGVYEAAAIDARKLVIGGVTLALRSATNEC